MSNIQSKTQAFFKYSKMKSGGSQTGQGFTLIEMLLVIAIIAILAGIVIVAINPGRQLAQARNAERQSDLNAIYKALDQYYIDNRKWPDSDMSSSLTEICDTGSIAGDGIATGGIGDSSCDGKIDLSNLVPDYLTAIPTDPLSGGIYAVALPASNRPQLTAPSSTEYSLDIVAIGTTTSEVAGGGEEDTTVADLRVSLVGYWPLDEDNSTQPDESENDNTGTVSGATYTSSGKISGAYSFGGDGDNIDISGESTFDFTTSYSVSVWFKGMTGSSNGALLAKGSGAWRVLEKGTDNILQPTHDGLSPSYVNVDGQNWDDGEWHHAVMVYNSSDNTYKVFMDGDGSNPDESQSVSGTPLTNNTNLRIGQNAGTPSQMWGGVVDEVAVWSRALSADEIDDLYNSGSGLSLISE